MKRLVLSTFIVGLIVVAMGHHARADVPWAAGVSTDVQNKANALFAEGNQLFAQQAHAPALEKYRAAIALWDHPLIRFNMAVTEIRLDRILDAADDLEKALRYGNQPFSAELYQQAQDYQRLVSGRVGFVQASCDQKETHVLLDGKPWFDCPGTQKVRVLGGEHAVVGERKGYVPLSRRLVVAGGATKSEKLELVPIDSVVILKYPNPRWIPWTITGTGVAVALGGLAFYFAGKNQMDKFEADFAMQCPTGCLADLSDQPLLAGERDSAKLKGKIAITMMVAGSGIAIGGAVWGGFINRPKRYLPAAEIAPTSGGGVARLWWHF